MRQPCVEGGNRLSIFLAGPADLDAGPPPFDGAHVANRIRVGQPEAHPEEGVDRITVVGEQCDDVSVTAILNPFP